MRIFKYDGKLVEEVASVSGEKVVFFKYLREEDKEKCPHCSKPLDTTIDMVEGCLNWQGSIKPVDTITSLEEIK